jgi:hypothetical protein
LILDLHEPVDTLLCFPAMIPLRSFMGYDNACKIADATHDLGVVIFSYIGMDFDWLALLGRLNQLK